MTLRTGLFLSCMFAIASYAYCKPLAKPELIDSSKTPEIWFPNTTITKQVRKSGDGHYYFWFKNVGDAPLKILKASSTGGSFCPTAPRKSILPNEWGLIHIQYDTKRVGLINQTCTITSNTLGRPVRLKMSGMVYPDDHNSSIPIQGVDPNSKLHAYNLFIDKCAKTGYYEASFEVINQDTTAHSILEIDVLKSIAGFNIIDEHIFPIVIPPKERKTIPIKINLNLTKDIQLYDIKLRTDENLANPFFILKVKAFSKEYSYARIQLDSTMLHRNFVHMGPNTFSYHFENVGTAPLIISTIKYSGNIGLRSYPRNEPIQPGERGEIKMMCNTRYSGPFHKSITICSNGYEPRVVVRIRGEVFAEK